MVKKRIRLLLLTCGTNACYHVAKRLKECFGGRVYIIGADINHRWMIPTHPYLDQFYQCPLSSEEVYYQFILNICKQEDVNYLLPSYDVDQQMFYEGNADLKLCGVESLGITKEAKAIYNSKEKTNRFLEKIGLPVPRFYSKENIKDNEFYFCKPCHGVGSIGIKKMKGEELRNDKTDDLIIEEVCTGPEITLECFNYGGKLYSVARERLDTKSGVCTKARIYQDKNLQTIAQLFVDSIRLPYIFNLQFMTNCEGCKVITDVNLRTAGGMSLSFAAGWDEVKALGKIMLGEENVTASLKAPQKDIYVVRAYTDIITKKCQQRIAFDLDGTLLDSRKRHQVVMDYVLAEYGISLDTSNLLAYKIEGYSNKEWLRMKKLTPQDIERVNNRWIELIETEEFLAGDTLYPNVWQYLEKLSNNNRLFLLTARNNKENTEKQISKLGISQFFDTISIVPSSKTTIDDKARLLKQFNVDVFYGDTESDMKAAEDAHCDFRAVTTGFRSKQFWSNFEVELAEIK